MRKRRPRVVWLPPDRFNRLNVADGATLGVQNGIQRFTIDLPGGPSSVVAVVPVVQDAQTETALLVTGSLADYEQSAYRLRRIVGKIFVSMSQDANGTTPEAIITAGLIVLRTKDQGGQVAPLNTTAEEYSPQMLQNWSDPWIWRRTWILSNLAAIAAGFPGRPFWPESNVEYGSVADGPHVDAKTARIVGPEERLFLAITATGELGDAQLITNIQVRADLRVLASMRSSQGNRRNASR